MKENEKYYFLKSLVEVLPDKPGVYQYFDKNGNILYVGKAQNLKKRVSSYFTQSSRVSFKQHLLLDKIADIKHIVVSSESDALLLENNLIKKLQPRYNVLLKDDKTFPWICVRNEPFPRIYSTRNIVRDGSVYYGPYTSGFMVKTLLEVTRQLFPLRTCKLDLRKENIEKKGFRVCLEFHLGNCLAPCVGLQDEKDYRASIEQAHLILKGNIKQVSAYLKSMMKRCSDEFRYEDAQRLKEKLEVLEKYRSKSTIVNPRIKNTDVYSFIEEGNHAFVNYLRVVDGAVIQAHTVEIRKKLDESREELLSIAIIDIRQKTMSNAIEAIVPFRIDIPVENVRFVVPKKGDRKRLLDLSERNAKYFQIEKKKKLESLGSGVRYERMLQTIKNDLRLKKLPEHIECFDNSNLQGANPVAACVVFRNAKPSKREYRHYHVKSVIGADDFASIKEIVYRRYGRLLKEKKSLPQLVIVDGGKGQLNSALQSIEKLGLSGKMAVIGVAKKLEEIYFPGDKIPLYLDKNSETLKVIQHLRNEAHRFGITFHRNLRTSSMLVSELDSIKGIGDKSKTLLFSTFGSVDKIRSADVEMLAGIVGRKKAELLRAYFLRSTT